VNPRYAQSRIILETILLRSCASSMLEKSKAILQNQLLGARLWWELEQHEGPRCMIGTTSLTPGPQVCMMGLHFGCRGHTRRSLGQPRDGLISLLGPVNLDSSFRALSGRLKFTVRRDKFNKDSLSSHDPKRRIRSARLRHGVWRLHVACGCRQARGRSTSSSRRQRQPE